MSDRSETSGTDTRAAAGLRLRIDRAATDHLEVIAQSVTTRGYPPSIREIGDAVGLTSTSSVAHQLRTLERKGYLRRDANTAARRRRPQRRGHADATGDRGRRLRTRCPSRRLFRSWGGSPRAGPILPRRPSRDVFPLPRVLVGEGSLSC